MAEEHLRGRLLVATPALRDPNFNRTVVLLLEHGDAGAVGLVLNRSSELAVAEVVPAWARLAADPPVVFFGGPVARQGAICLGEADPTSAEDGWQLPDGRLVPVDLDGDPAAVAARRLRIFAGHAGWGSGQLEMEIATGSWYVVPPLLGDVFAADPTQCYRQVLRRQGGRLALAATAPADPSLN